MYWYYFRLDQTNLVMIINNQIAWGEGLEKAIPINVEIYIDDKLIDRCDSVTDFYHFKSYRTSIGYHHLLIKVDSTMTYQTSFLLLPMKWFIIEYSRENLINVYDYNRLPILK